MRRAGSFALGCVQCGDVFVCGWVGGGECMWAPCTPAAVKPNPQPHPHMPPTHPHLLALTPPLSRCAALRCAAKYTKKGAKASNVATFLKDLHSLPHPPPHPVRAAQPST